MDYHFLFSTRNFHFKIPGKQKYKRIGFLCLRAFVAGRENNLGIELLSY